ncbi:MAG: SET domain-containing protein-lysine N-methyltransferase [Ginsengibacter sp.]
MDLSAYSLPNLTKLSHYGFASLYQNNVTGEKSLHATVSIRSEFIFSSFEAAETLAAPNKYTVQVNDDTHIILDPEYLQYMNHSCDPNVFFDTHNMQLSTLKDVAAGDELTFFYPSTEFAMASPFNCFCGANNCLHKIQGASYLSQEIIYRYKFTDFIMQKLNIPHLQKV